MSYGTSYRYNTNNGARRYDLGNDMPVFRSLTDVNKVIMELEKKIKENGSASVADFYSITDGVVVNEDYKYGWHDLLGIRIENSRYGYILNMPVAEALRFDPNAKIKTAIDILDNAGDDLEEVTNEVRELLCEMI